MKGHRPHRRRHANPAAWAIAIDASRPFPEEEATRIVNRVRVAYQCLRDGVASDEHFDRLGAAVNVAIVRCEQIGNSEPLQRLLVAAAKALMEGRALHARHGRYGLTGPGTLALNAGMDAYEEILRQSSARQMQAAVEEVVRRVNQQAAQA